MAMSVMPNGERVDDGVDDGGRTATDGAGLTDALTPSGFVGLGVTVCRA